MSNQNQFVFNVLRPKDKYHKSFLSTWIRAANVEQAREILARTYKAAWGYVLELKYDLNSIQEKAALLKLSNQSLNSASL